MPDSSRCLRVLDLFAGCGGFSLGFLSEGFTLAGAVEVRPEAAQTYQRNLAPHLPLDAICRDILDVSPEAFGPVDVIIGGPPCQAFSRIGRAKLRELSRCEKAHITDPRARLYQRYLAFVRTLRPMAIVMENVADMANHAGRNLASEICETLETEGYHCGYTLLNAVHYGVPQTRERLILMAIRQDLRVAPTAPEPTHSFELPRGYLEIRKATLRRSCSGQLFSWENRYSPPPEAAPHLPLAVTCAQALGDLPPFTLHLEGDYRSRSYEQTSPLSYRCLPDNEFAAMMRAWPGTPSSEGVFDHKMRELPRDYKIFRLMRPGDEYPEAYAIAERLFRKELSRQREAGASIHDDSPAYWELRKQCGPLYDPRKFPNRWRKMEPDRPARTLMAHLGKDSYTHIHYDSHQARTLSVREAARLQSFPDWFRFPGPMNPAFEQIGNAVPPLLARAISRHLRACLKNESQSRKELAHR